MITRNLCDLSKSSKKKTKIHSLVLKAESILKAFGHAATPRNVDDSCFSRYTEYQFDKRGKMVGAKFIDYLLEKNRATGATEDGGRSFHIFYHLLAGATHEEKQQWQLGDTVHYHYLSIPQIRVVTSVEDSAHTLSELRENFKSFGMGRRQQAQLFQLMAAILHLGNISFVDDPHKSDEPCTVKNYSQLALVADLLGIHPATLENTLTYKTQIIRKDTISVFLDSKSAAEQRDALARSLYAVAFSFIIEQINNKLCLPDSEWANYIAVLDIPGFATNVSSSAVSKRISSSSTTISSTNYSDIASFNGFHRLLLNYSNEKIAAFAISQLFDLPRGVLQSEGLPYPSPSITSSTSNNNHNLLQLLEGPDGILPIIDTESVRGTKESKITEIIHSEHSSNSYFATPSSQRKSKHLFAIRHSFQTPSSTSFTLSSASVEYDTKGFVARNTDILQSDFVTLIRGNPDQPGTSSLFLRSLFSDRMISTLSHAQDSSTLIAASSKSRYPSMKRSKNGSEQDQGDREPVIVDIGSTIGFKVF